MLFLFILGIIFSNVITEFIITHRVESLNQFFINLGYLRAGFSMLFLAIVLLFMKKKRINWFFVLFLSFSMTFGIVYLLKNIFQISRPLFNALIVETGYAFPSGHAAGSFSVIPVLFKVYNKSKYLWLTLAILISFSRIYVGVHTLMQVLVGGLIGFLIGKLFVYLEEKHNLFKLVINFFKMNDNR